MENFQINCFRRKKLKCLPWIKSILIFIYPQSKKKTMKKNDIAFRCFCRPYISDLLISSFLSLHLVISNAFGQRCTERAAKKKIWISNRRVVPVKHSGQRRRRRTLKNVKAFKNQNPYMGINAHYGYDDSFNLPNSWR